ncbi:MAG: YceI family protein [Cyclobacteriaceae bacterium]
MIKAFIIFAVLFSGEAKEVKVNTEASVIKWTGSKIVGNSHTGTIALKSGSLDITGGKLKGGSFVVDMTTLTDTDLSGNMKGKLEGHLKSDDFFGVETYPTAEFVITKVKSAGEGAYDVTGDITIKGKTESISFSTTLNEKDGGYEAVASISVDRSKFDVRYGSDTFFDNLGDKAISNEFKLEVTLVTGD